MARRKKIYYAENEIVRNLETIGSEFMLFDNWENYSGSYHRYESTNEVFTEPDWHSIKSKKLVPYKEKPKSYFQYQDIINYVIINGEKKELFGTYKMDRYSAPVAVIRQPRQSEKDSGFMTRYFLFKRNERNTRLPIEIDKKQAVTYSTPTYGINQFLYALQEIPWKIDGPEFDVIENGILKIPGVYNTNQRIVEKYSKKFPILKQVLMNFREFSIYNRNT